MDGRTKPVVIFSKKSGDFSVVIERLRIDEKDSFFIKLLMNGKEIVVDGISATVLKKAGKEEHREAIAKMIASFVLNIADSVTNAVTADIAMGVTESIENNRKKLLRGTPEKIDMNTRKSN